MSASAEGQSCPSAGHHVEGAILSSYQFTRGRGQARTQIYFLLLDHSCTLSFAKPCRGDRKKSYSFFFFPSDTCSLEGGWQGLPPGALLADVTLLRMHTVLVPCTRLTLRQGSWNIHFNSGMTLIHSIAMHRKPHLSCRMESLLSR